MSDLATNYPMWVKFASEEDALKAIDILFHEGESYRGRRPRLFLISQKALRIFEEQGVHFSYAKDADWMVDTHSTNRVA